MIKTSMKIDGMMCGMCEAHVCDTIRKAVPSAKKVSASRSKKEGAVAKQHEKNKKSRRPKRVASASCLW